MRIGIVGVGGIGGFIGAKLCAHITSNKHTVVFFQRGEHARAIQQYGLTFVQQQQIVVHPHEMYESLEDASGMFDVLFFCTKSKDLEQTARMANHLLHPDSLVISLLNGVDNAARLHACIPQIRVLDGCIYVSASITSPGVVTQKGGAGKVYLGTDTARYGQQDYAIVNLLLEAGVSAELSDDIVTQIWKKYLFISPFATITSRYNLPIGTIVRNDLYRAQAMSLIQEVKALGVCNGAKLTDVDVQQVIDLAFKIPESTPTSMQLDVYAGKYPELDVFTEFVVRNAVACGIQTPQHEEMLPEIQTIVNIQMHGK